MAWHSATNAADAVLWMIVAVLFAAVVPMVYVVRGVRRRRLTDHHVRQREQRPLPLMVGLLSVLIGVALLVLGNAPRELVALVTAMSVGLGSSLLVTLVWKISIHVAVVAGATVILVLVFGPAALGFAPAVVLAAWARVALGDHTPGQVIVGAGLGALVALSVFSVLR